MSNKRLIIVIGMHRSGTSAITRALELLGVSLGENLHPAGFDNPTGFWEDRECLEINEELLLQCGSAYDRLGLAQDILRNNPSTDSLKQKAKQLVTRKLEENNGMWGFKDPRTCRLLPFWREVFDSIGCETSYIIALRNPLSVTSSLLARNNIPLEKGYFLWLQHIVPAILDTKGFSRILVDYDLFMDAPFEQMSRMSAALNLPMPEASSPIVRTFVDDFLNKNLRHTKYTLDVLETHGGAPFDVVNAYQILLSVAHDKTSLDDPVCCIRFNELNKRLEDFAPIFSYTNALEDERTSLCLVLAERDAQLAERDAQFAERDVQLATILNCKSWRLTKPLRYLKLVIARQHTASLRRQLSDGAHRIWRAIPLSIQSKQRLKSKIFMVAPILFRHTAAYQKWYDFRGCIAHDTQEQLGMMIHQPEEQYVPLLQAAPLKDKPSRLICFYLPQFHAIPENNEWWGEGFTEWTNVQPAQPQFAGHYQPHVPGELGYYNLLDPAIQHRQVELGKLYGIEGFCFYFYWFGGKRLLETPTENYLNDKSLDLPFCLCWANENWSRRWDGLDTEILIAQQHSPDDDLEFIKHVAQYMRDSRYIRVDDKPLLLVYRPSLLPSAKDTAKRWRDWCQKSGLGEIYLAYTQSFDAVDPATYGFDAAVEFPPNNSAPPSITKGIEPLTKNFNATVFDWRVFVEQSRRYVSPSYKLFRSVCPSWDNTARRKNKGTVFVNNTPALYQHWLENAIADTVAHQQNPDERIVFINAWNEWAEGAHLEPDVRYGYAWLQATRNALVAQNSMVQHQVLVVTHDCHPHGAQFLILEVTRRLVSLGYRVHIVALDGGRLQAEFARLGPMVVGSFTGADGLRTFLAGVRNRGCEDAITSTVVSGSILPSLKRDGFRVVSLIHELPGVIRGMKQEANARHIAELADKVVFPAVLVRDQFDSIAQVPVEKAIVRPQGLLRKNPYKGKNEIALEEVRRRHGLRADTRVVLNVGYLDQRKGADLFVEVAGQVCLHLENAVFIWVGHADPALENMVKDRIEQLGLQARVLLIGFDPEPLVYYAAASVYALTSREDPFPNVVLESVAVGVPVVAFEGTTGAADFIVEHGGKLARSLDVSDFAGALVQLLDQPSVAKDVAAPDLSLQRYVLDLMHHLNGQRRVSVIVPNYNYANLIEGRIDSIIAQMYPVYELIVLDDASTDDSVSRIEGYCHRHNCDAKISINEVNSGSVFRQWVKGVREATGDLVWIAEADDLASSNFLSALVPAFGEKGVVLAFCQSRQINEKGGVLENDYLAYTEDIAGRWRTDNSAEGIDVICSSMAIKNVIPNVSAVLFDRRVLLRALETVGEELFDYRVAGDWLIYLHVLAQGRVFYSAKSLNDHRRHQRSVTSATSLQNHLDEVAKVQSAAKEIAQPDEKVLAQAGAYLAHLRDQFQLTNLDVADSHNA